MNRNKLPNEFKALILDMYRGFPKYVYYGMVDRVVPTESLRENLVAQNIIVKDKYVDLDGTLKEGYMLGAGALQLISAWENEKVARQTKKLTKRIELYTIIMLAITFIALMVAILKT